MPAWSVTTADLAKACPDTIAALVIAAIAAVLQSFENCVIRIWILLII
jgi:hypothetical protein